MEFSITETHAIKSIQSFLKATEDIELDSKLLTPASNTALGEMVSIGRQLLNYYKISHSTESLTPKPPKTNG